MISVDEMVVKLRTHTGEDSSDLPDVDALLILNQAWWEVIDKFAFREKERDVVFTLTTGVDRYPAPTPFEALQTIGVINEEGDTVYLKRMTTQFYETLEKRDPETGDKDRGIPEWYLRRESDFIVWPVPRVELEGIMYYWTTLTDLETGEIPQIPQVWHEIILYGGVYRRFLEIGDYIKAKSIRNDQVALINSTSSIEAKEETDSRLSGVELPPELTMI